MSSEKKKTLEAKFDSYVEDGWKLEPVVTEVSNISEIKKKKLAFSALKVFKKKNYHLIGPSGHSYDICGDCCSEMDAHFLDESEKAYRIISEINDLSRREKIKYRKMYMKK